MVRVAFSVEARSGMGVGVWKRGMKSDEFVFVWKKVRHRGCWG